MPAKTIITIGADPEFFVFDYEKGHMHDGSGLPGTKEKPVPLTDNRGKPMPGFFWHRDTVTAELAIPPSKEYPSFASHIKNGRHRIDQAVQRHSNGVVGLDQRHIMTEFNPRHLTDDISKTFGCEPDFSAYDGGAERSLGRTTMGNYRYAGGHLHIGTTTGFNCPDFIVAIMADLFWAAYGQPDPVDITQSHSWYRRPGLYRPKPYGIEYRTPSNRWATLNGSPIRAFKAMKLCGHYCANASAVAIRSAIEGLDIVTVQTRLTAPELSKKQQGDTSLALQDYCKTIMTASGLDETDFDFGGF